MNNNAINKFARSALESYITREQLPGDYIATVEQWFLPVVDQVVNRKSRHGETYVVGISGSQGSGKSTLAQVLLILLNEQHGLSGVSMSLDDFYLTHAERQALAERVHPLLATRGVPGTHDVALAVRTLEALKRPGEVAIPRFNKGIDDREAPHRWPRVQAPLDVVVLEGWCLNVGAQSAGELEEPVNELEAVEDRAGVWRRYVNDHLAGEYSRLHTLVDYLIMLKAPGFDKVLEWRRNQEKQLARTQQPAQNSSIMSEADLRRFVQHYERLTRHALATLPPRADVVLELNDQQRVENAWDRENSFCYSFPW